MSYFSHGFTKVFVGTKPTQAGSGSVTAVTDGCLHEAGLSTSVLGNTAAPNALGLGTYGFFNKDTYLSVVHNSDEVTQGQPLIFASAAIMANDKIGKFHGGYAESNKSKMINPKLITKFYKVEDATPQNQVVHIGNTPFVNGTLVSLSVAGSGYQTDGVFTDVATTGGSGSGFTVDITIAGGVVTNVVENQVGTGYVQGETLTISDVQLVGTPTAPGQFDIIRYNTQDCESSFVCGETYNLFINLSGSPVLRYLNRDAYETLAAYTGCCPEGTIEPEAVDSTLVMIEWAKQIVASPILGEFLKPVVYDQEGASLFMTAEDAILYGVTPGVDTLVEYYVSPGVIEGKLAGLRLESAYVDTEFSTCSYQPSDYHNKDIIKMDISLVDNLGNPCEFKGLCITTECCGSPGQGFGDSYLKELLLSESYLQNCRSTDPRIREITQGNSATDAIDKHAFYTKYVIQHVVPRYGNPSSIHDNDMYNLVILMPSGTDATYLETVMTTWLINAGNPLGEAITTNGVETYGMDKCTITTVKN